MGFADHGLSLPTPTSQTYPPYQTDPTHPTSRYPPVTPLSAARDLWPLPWLRMTVTVIVCAHNEASFVAPCLYSLLAQTRPPDEILVVDNASTDGTGDVAGAVPGVRVVEEPRKGLVVARERGRREATGDLLVYVDADCRAPLQWLSKVEAPFNRTPALVAVSGSYRFYDWDWWGRLLIGLTTSRSDRRRTSS